MVGVSKQFTRNRLGNASILEARIMSHPARGWVDKVSPSRVLHVFPHACNLINDEGEVLSIVGSEIGVGPFSIVLRVEANGSPSFEGFSEWVDVSSPIRKTLDSIYLGELKVDTRNAEIWDPIPNWSRIRTSRQKWLALLPTLQKTMDKEAPRESLYEIVDQVLSVGAEEPGKDTTIGLIHTQAIGPARKLCGGIFIESLETIREGTMGLAGLGGGLTPAGDDFILGVLLALRTISIPEESSRIADMILSIVKPRTSSLSTALLQAVAQGEIHETWHRFFEAMVADSHEQLQTAVRRILAIGHSSGADALAGFLTLNLIFTGDNV